MPAIEVPVIEDDEPPPHSDADYQRVNGYDHAAEKESAKPMPPRIGVSPASIAERWATTGEVKRVSTGIAPLDELCNGGFPFPWRVALVGAPGAGKTAKEACIANTMAMATDPSGPCVGMNGVDEDVEDLTVRLAEMAGYSLAEVERRDPESMLTLAQSLSRLRLRLYDGSWTIDSAAADLGAWAKSESRPAALFIDSIQTASSAASEALERRDARSITEANVRTVRVLSDQHAMLVVYTSEANRSTYRNKGGSDQDDIASGAETRAIEYGAQTVLVLRTPAGHDDIVHVTVPKNRRAHRDKVGFYLRLDRARHTLTPCDSPDDDSDATESKGEAKDGAVRAQLDRDARELLRIVLANPGLSTRDLRAAVKTAGKAWGRDRLDAVKHRLCSGIAAGCLVNRGVNGSGDKWFVESASSEGSNAEI